MTDLEKNCISALRLSDASATALLDTIQLNISIARAELIRSGITDTKANDDTDYIIENLIIKYVVGEMASIESERNNSKDAFRLCLDEARKTVSYAE